MAKNASNDMLDNFLEAMQEVDTASGIGVTRDYRATRTVFHVAAHVQAQHPDWKLEFGGAGGKVITLAGRKEGNCVFYEAGSVVPAKISLPETWELTADDKTIGDALYEAYQAKVKADAKAAKEREKAAKQSVSANVKVDQNLEV